MADHAVIVHFQYGSTDLSRLFVLEDELERAIAAAGAGEFDGNEVAADGSDGYLYMYGPDGTGCLPPCARRWKPARSCAAPACGCATGLRKTA